MYRLLAIFSLIFLFAAPVWAVETQGDILVEVFNEETEEPVAGATIVIQDQTKQRAPIEVKSGEDGTVRVKNLPAGDYRVEVKHPDFGADGAIIKVTANADNTFSAYLAKSRDVEVVTIRDERLLVNTKDPNAGATTTRNQDFVKKQVTGQGLQAVVSTAPGVQTNSVGQVHVRGEHKSVTVSLDGVNVPVPLETSITQPLDPEFLENLEIRTGNFDASQGGQLGVVLNASTPTGVEKPYVEVIGRVGDRGQNQQMVRAAGSNGKGFSYFVGAKRAESDLYQEAPHPRRQELHNNGELNSVLVRFNNKSDNDEVGLTLSHQSADIQLPQTPENFAAGVRQDQQDRNTLALISWKHEFSEDDDLLLGLAYLRSAQDVRNNGVFTTFTGVPANVEEELAEEGFPLDPERPGSPYLPRTNLNVTQIQPSAEFTRRLGEDHRIKVGATANFIQARQTIDVLDMGGGGGLPNPSGLPGNVTRFRADIDRDAFIGGLFFSHTLPLSDTVTLNYGVRADTFDNGIGLSTGQISPLLNLTWGPTDNQAVRFSYNRLFQPPPLEVDVSGQTEVQPQRTHAFELSYENQLARNLVGKVAYVYKDYRDQIDVGLLIPGSITPVFGPVNFARARYQGLELSLNTSNETGWNGFLAATLGEAKPLEPGIFAGHFPRFNDHDQRVQVTAGLSHSWDNGLSAGADVLYGSGYPQEALPLYNSIGIRPFGLSGDRQDRFITNLNIQYLPENEDGVDLGVGLKVFNLFDDRSVLNFLSEFSGTRFVRGRRFLFNGQIRF